MYALGRTKQGPCALDLGCRWRAESAQGQRCGLMHSAQGETASSCTHLDAPSREPSPLILAAGDRQSQHRVEMRAHAPTRPNTKTVKQLIDHLDAPSKEPSPSLWPAFLALLRAGFCSTELSLQAQL